MAEEQVVNVEATIEAAKAENETVLAQLLSANKAEEPGELKQHSVIDRGTGDAPMPMVTKEISSAGYSFIWDNKTGERSLTNNNMLPTQLRKKRSDGTPVFTVYNPGITPKRGTHKCMLHAENPNRGEYDELGLAVCTKANLNSPYQVRRHMQKRHKDEWQSIEHQLKEAERLEERAERKQYSEAMFKVAGAMGDKGEGKPPVYVSDKDKATKKK